MVDSDMETSSPESGYSSEEGWRTKRRRIEDRGSRKGSRGRRKDLEEIAVADQAEFEGVHTVQREISTRARESDSGY